MPYGLPFQIMSVSEARKKLEKLPLYFENNEEPIIITHQGQPSMILMDMEMFMAMGGMSQFIREQGLDKQYEKWLETMEPASEEEIDAAFGVHRNK